MNILEKVATSPFSLLGAVFGGGGEELGYQDFAPGSAELTAADAKKLDVLAKGLYARPALQLEISGSIDPDGDREGLQRAALDKQIRTAIWMKLRKSAHTNSVDQIVLPPDERAQWIRKLYAEAMANRKITPELIAANTNLADYAAQVLPRSLMEKRRDDVDEIANAKNQTPPNGFIRPNSFRRPIRWKRYCWRHFR